jgi:serine/threonine protein phosphatase PrpC
MADFVLRIGSCSARGVRPNNEDRLVVDREHQLFMVADGMGGQDQGERASGLAAEIIPRVVQDGLSRHDQADALVQQALSEANRAIIEAARDQPENRRMGTTAVVALQKDGKMYVASLGDSRAYLIRGDRVEQLTVDHSVAQALVDSGVFTPEEAKRSPLQHVLHRFLGCAHMPVGADIHPFAPQARDRLLLGSDGLTNHVTPDDFREGAARFSDPQAWADHLVATALERGSRDNVTCVVVFFEAE